MFWPAGYGTGDINAMCVSVVNLATLKTLSASEARNSSVFGGLQFHTTSNYTGYKEQYGYLKPGIEDFTTEEEMLIKVSNTTYLYNLVTGDYSVWGGTFPSNLPFYGVNYVTLEGKLYYVSPYGSSQYRVTEVDLVTKTARYGSAGSNVDYLSSAILVGSDIYFQTARTNATITLKKLNISTLAIESTTITINLPSYITTTNRNAATITQFDNGDYGLIDGASGICYRFTDLEDIEGSVIDVFFTGATAGYPAVPISSGIKTLFLGISENGFFQNATLAGKNNGVYKFILTDGRYGPLIAYNKFEKSYNKSETAELTSSVMITISAL